MTVPKAEIEISARLDSFERSIAKLNSLAQSSAKKIEASFSGVGSSLAAAVAGAASLGALSLLVKNVADAGDAVGKLSVRSGIAAEELSKLQYAADLSDVSNEDLANSLARLNKVLGEAADGGKEATDALARFGIAPGSMSALDAFRQIADRVKNTSDQTKIASAMNDVFGKSWQTLVPMIKGGSEGLKDAGDELERMGGVMSGDLAKASEAFNDNLTRLNTQLGALKIQTIGPLIPMLQEMTGALAESSDKMNGLAASGGVLKTAFEAIGALGVNVSYVFKQTGNEIGGMAAQLAALGKGDFKGAASIGAMMKEDAKKAREEVDALTYRILHAQDMVAANKLKDSWLPQSPTAAPGAAITGTPVALKTPKALKPAKQDDDFADFLKDIEARIKPAEQALESFRQMQLDAAVSGADLTAAEKKFYDLINSPEWATMADPWKELVTQQFEVANATEKAADEQQRLNSLLSGLDSSKIEQAWQDMELLNKALEAGKISQSQYAEATEKLFDGGAEKIKEQKTLAEELGMTFSSAFEDAIVEGKKFGDVLDGLAQDVLRIMVRKNVTEPLTNAIGSINWGSLFTNAKGGVYDSPSLSAYSGGVYTTPQFFKFASGAGVFAEAGPEAIMPLSRTSDGKLGVKAQGTGNVSIVINNMASDQVETTAQPRMNNGKLEIEVLVQKVLSSDMSRNGPITQGLAQTFGMARKV